jgi:hypothetical protein
VRDLAAQLDPRLPRHDDVADYQVRSSGFDDGSGLPRARRLLHVMSLRPQQAREHHPHRVIVVHDQDLACDWWQAPRLLFSHTRATDRSARGAWDALTRQ